MSRLVVSLLCVSVLASCGLKGPLYLPDKDANPVVITPAASSSSSAASRAAP